MSELLSRATELLNLIPATQRWIVVVALVGGGVYYATHESGQVDNQAIIDTYTNIVRFEAEQAAQCAR